MREDLSVWRSSALRIRAFFPALQLDSGVGPGSPKPKENPLKQKARASVLIQIGTEKALGAMRRFP
jgi:hypothetical protein